LPVSVLQGFQVGLRESAQSWRALLVDLKAHGLVIAPELPPAMAPLVFRRQVNDQVGTEWPTLLAFTRRERSGVLTNMDFTLRIVRPC
jgi:hypothetical protein